MTLRLYYSDSYNCEFKARIIEQEEKDDGPIVRLDQSAFYPTSGGQPYDTGTLGGSQVLDVWEDEQGRIWHSLDGLPDEIEITGLVDWQQRFDHMQQHTGQHILSAAFLDVLDAATIGFHMGTESSTIDLDIPSLSKEDIRKIEATANRVVWENRLVKIKIVTERELDAIPFRKPPQVSGDIRVIWVEGYDASACGGTHVRTTGEVGIIKISSKERYKGGMRITFLCGGRALKDYQRALDSVQQVSNSLSIHQDELGETIARIQAELKMTRRELAQSHQELMAHEADQLWQQTPEIGGTRKVAAYLLDHSFDDIRAIAENLRQRPKTLILLAVADGENLRLLCTRSDDLEDVDASVILKDAAQTLGGRGGGSPAMAQGGAPKADQQTITAVFQKTFLK